MLLVFHMSATFSSWKLFFEPLGPQSGAIEILTPDFKGKRDAVKPVAEARPDVFNHNLETIRRLTPKVRSRANYDRSLTVLKKVKERSKSKILDLFG